MDRGWKELLWPLVTLAGIVSSLILFWEQTREQLQELLQKIASIEIDPRARRFKVRFAQQVKHAKARANGIREKVATNRSLPVDDYLMNRAEQAARDVVLEAWGAIKQTVYDACIAGKIPLTPAVRIPQAVRRLVKANAVDPSLAYLINLLYDLGQELADNPRLKPMGTDAVVYREIIDDIVDWFMLRVLSPGNREEPKRQQTIIARNSRQLRSGASFSPPRPGHPTALLIAVGGSLRGRRFSIEKEHFWIGRDSDNDLPIPEDAFVSGRHASLRFKQGNLFISDQGSSNGTFLNKKKVVGVSEVRWGDQIQLGKSIFQVSEASVR